MLRVENFQVKNPRNAGPEVIAFISKIEAEGWEFIAFSPPMVPHQVPPPLFAVFRKVEAVVTLEDIHAIPADQPRMTIINSGDTPVVIKKKRKPGRPKKNA